MDQKQEGSMCPHSLKNKMTRLETVFLAHGFCAHISYTAAPLQADQTIEGL
jgi:hypothetical protein